MCSSIKMYLQRNKKDEGDNHGREKYGAEENGAFWALEYPHHHYYFMFVGGKLGDYFAGHE